MVKLLVAISLLSVGLAKKELYARVDELEVQAEVMKGLVQCLSEATTQQCDEVCTDIIPITKTKERNAGPSQALGGVGDITFKCYGEDVTVLDGKSAVCLPPTPAPTAEPSSKPTAAPPVEPSTLRSSNGLP